MTLRLLVNKLIGAAARREDKEVFKLYYELEDRLKHLSDWDNNAFKD